MLQDTFLDAAHVKESFPANEVEVVNGTGVAGEPKRPFKVAFPPPPAEPQPTAKVQCQTAVLRACSQGTAFFTRAGYICLCSKLVCT